MKIFPESLSYIKGESIEARRKKRQARVRLLMRDTQVETKIIEVPVERIVEKIVYRDPPAKSTLRKAEAGLEAAQAKLAARDKPDAVPDELQEHVKEGETVAETKVRFLVLYRDLGNKIMMGRAEKHEIRLHESLSAKMNWITGD